MQYYYIINKSNTVDYIALYDSNVVIIIELRLELSKLS